MERAVPGPAAVRRATAHRACDTPCAVTLETQSAPGLWSLPQWAQALPRITHGITTLGDMSLWGGGPTAAVLPRWTTLRERLGFPVVVHARQVHGSRVHVHHAVPDGLLVVADADGHATSHSDVLLAVSVADCVPIFIAEESGAAVALLHGGWRGVAAGILEQGLDVLRSGFGIAPHRLWVHCGPAICGDCYEVGPEVPAALGLPEVSGRSHVDVRDVIAVRARAAGVLPGRITQSGWCTRHGDSPFYSHRGGSPERQVAVLGIREVI